jgi:hypothetical protein
MATRAVVKESAKCRSGRAVERVSATGPSGRRGIRRLDRPVIRIRRTSNARRSLREFTGRVEPVVHGHYVCLG